MEVVEKVFIYPEIQNPTYRNSAKKHIPLSNGFWQNVNHSGPCEISDQSCNLVQMHHPKFQS